ncbi:MAG TPA: I78 family peptidase inhibitor [Bordetella sp.]|nr:I78 family peptidase inhibitor [Bordetella sp.]
MIRKLIPAILIASLAACANTGRQASSTDADSTASSTSSSSVDSTGSAGGGYTGGSGSTDSGGYAGGSGGTDSGGYSGGSGSSDSGASDGGYGAAAGGGYGSPFSGGKGCDAQPVQNMIGTKLSSSVENQIKQASSSSKTRVLKPGEVMTMEYDPQRINLILDQQGALTALRCG